MLSLSSGIRSYHSFYYGIQFQLNDSHSLLIVCTFFLREETGITVELGGNPMDECNCVREDINGLASFITFNGLATCASIFCGK